MSLSNLGPEKISKGIQPAKGDGGPGMKRESSMAAEWLKTAPQASADMGLPSPGLGAA